MEDVTIRRCETGADLYSAMEHQLNDAHFIRNRVGMKIRTDPRRGGGNANGFFKCSWQLNDVGILADRTAKSPMHNNLFAAGLVQANRLCGFAGFGLKGGWVFDTTHFEANGSGEERASEIDGRQIERCCIFLDAAELEVRGEISEARVSPAVALRNGSVLRAVNTGGYGNSTGRFIDGTLSDIVEFYGRLDALGSVTAYVARWPDRLFIRSRFAAIGIAVRSASPLLAPDYESDAPTLAGANGGAAANAADADAVLGTVSSVQYAASAGSPAVNRVIVAALPDGVAAGDQWLIELWARADTPTRVNFSVAEQSFIAAPLDAEWRRIILAFRVREPATPKLHCFPSGADGPKVYFTKMRSLRVSADGDPHRLWQMLAGLS
jgi:hypothetical protein